MDFDESEHKELGEILNFAQSDSSDPEIQRKYYEGYYAQLMIEIMEQEREKLSKECEIEQDEEKKKAQLQKLAELIEKINQLRKRSISI